MKNVSTDETRAQGVKKLLWKNEKFAFPFQIKEFAICKRMVATTTTLSGNESNQLTLNVRLFNQFCNIESSATYNETCKSRSKKSKAFP